MPIDYSEQCEQLRIRMSRLRHNLDYEVDELVDQANHLMEWKYYLQNFPFVSLGVIGLVAYNLVPRKKSPEVIIDESSLQRLMEQGRTSFKQGRTEKPSMLRSLLEVTAQSMLRTGLTFMTRKLIAETMYHSDAEMERDEITPASR